MERLSDTAIEIINDLHTERLEYASEYIPLIDAANRLAAYEGTGLEPEAVRRLMQDWTSLIMTLDELGGMPHLRELVQAEKDGRLVVLPCRDDVELERNGQTFRADHWNHSLTAFRDAPETKSGKQVALFSIEEAKAELEGGKDNA